MSELLKWERIGPYVLTREEVKDFFSVGEPDDETALREFMGSLDKARIIRAYESIASGTLVLMARESGVNKAGEVGVVYEVYDRGEGLPGISIIFENGGYCGYSFPDWALLGGVVLGSTQMEYDFTTVGDLVADYHSGAFDELMLAGKIASDLMRGVLTKPIIIDCPRCFKDNTIEPQATTPAGNAAQSFSQLLEQNRCVRCGGHLLHKQGRNDE